MIQQGLFKGVCTFSGLDDYVAGDPVFLNIFDAESMEHITAELTEQTFQPGIANISQSTGTNCCQLTGCLQDTGKLKLHSPEGIQLILEISPEGNLLTGEYYREGKAPANISFCRI